MSGNGNGLPFKNPVTNLLQKSFAPRTIIEVFKECTHVHFQIHQNQQLHVEGTRESFVCKPNEDREGLLNAERSTNDKKSQRQTSLSYFLFALTKHKICVLCVLNTHLEATMRTNIVIDDDLLEEAFSVSQARTKKDLVHEALREFVRVKKRKNLTELAGSIEFYKGFDHKELRKMRG